MDENAPAYRYVKSVLERPDPPSSSAERERENWGEDSQLLPYYPGQLSVDQESKVMTMKKHVSAKEKEEAFGVVDAERALKVFYDYPGSVRQHVAARYLESFQWKYMIHYNFWYIFCPYPETLLPCAYYYSFETGRIIAQDLESFIKSIDEFKELFPALA